MNHEGSDAGATDDSAKLRNLRLRVPASQPTARVAGKDLKTVTPQRAGAARGPHQALADRNVDAQAHPPYSPSAGGCGCRPSQSRISAGLGL